MQDLGPPDSRIDEFYKTFTLPNGYDANLKIWRSNTTPLSERPLILLFHGGGFFGGSIEMMTRPGRELAKAFGAVVVSSSYRLAPENRWPTSVMGKACATVRGCRLSPRFIETLQSQRVPQELGIILKHRDSFDLSI